MRKLVMFFGLTAMLALSGCGYNDFQTRDEGVKKAWAEVLNQYQRRSDLIPNLVATVQGYAQQEKDVFLGVTNARAKVGQMNIGADVVNNPEALKNFQKAQGDLSSALSRLLVVAENYPQLKSDANFRELQSQLEGTENRITVARKRFTDAVEAYNVLARQFPTNLTAMLFSYTVKPQFTVENEKAISTAPKVDFGAKPAAPSEPAATPAPATPK
jgi:LemA protein